MNTSILVVDDDDAHRGMLRMMLQAWGYSVDEAADGDLAVEAVRAKPYDVVLTDVRMGRMDGIHALRGILDTLQDSTLQKDVLLEKFDKLRDF